MSDEVSGFVLEADWLHRFFFKTRPSPGWIEQYVQAEQAYLRSGRPCRISLNVPQLIQAGVDLEALEFYLRLTRRTNDLTRKFATCCMLSEVKCCHLDRFVAQSDLGLPRALANLVLSVFRAAFKLPGGALEARKLGLV